MPIVSHRLYLPRRRRAARPNDQPGRADAEGVDLHKKLAAEQAPHVKTVLERQIESTDREIDRLVYELYGLTDEEIAVVEG